MRVGSLFSGIGGIDLGLTRAGMEIAWQVKIDPWCRKVLAKHFPEAKRYADIRDCGANNLDPVDLIAGGFPCQDISNAGARVGIDGERSGLWSEMWRVVGELRPRYVFVENVAALLGRGMGRVIGDLARLGYDAEWKVISAADMGAPHLRERIWIVAYPAQFSQRKQATTPNAVTNTWQTWHEPRFSRDAKNAIVTRLERYVCESVEGTRERRYNADASRPDWWAIEPDVGRVADGIPSRMDRLKGLGNAAIPQIPEMIGREILRLEAAA